MFRKLLALEVAALANEDRRPEPSESDFLASVREIFTPRTANYGSMWSTRSGG